MSKVSPRPESSPVAPTGSEAAVSTSARTAPRILALDAHRGLAIVVMILLNSAGIHAALPSVLKHPEWHGLSFADTFFPVFLFAMGAAMEFSTRAQRVLLVLRRVAILFAIGVALQWIRLGEPKLAGILQKIAVAYLLGWVVLRLPRRLHLPVAAGALLLAWAAFTFVQAPGVVPGSWEPRTNLAAFLDRVVIGGAATEGFASALMATINVVGGALVIRSLRGLEARDALNRLLWWAGVAMIIGLLMAPAVPINKRIWTPSFTILTHGIACLYLAILWWAAEIRGKTRAIRPLIALGRNPIFLYVLFTVAHAVLTPVRMSVAAALAGLVGRLAASLMWSGTLTLMAWGLAEWMDRRRLYVRV